MKRLLLILWLLTAIFTVSYGQNSFYYYQDNKIPLEEIKEKKFILFDNTILKETQAVSLLGSQVSRIDTFVRDNILGGLKKRPNVEEEASWALVRLKADMDLSSVKNISYTGSFYKTKEGKEVALTHLIYVKLKKEESIQELEALAKKHKFRILGNNNFMPLWYLIDCSNAPNENAITLANLLYETGLFSASEPDLMSNDELVAECTPDPYFSSQWGLKNTGQNGGNIGVDIKACDAWDITKGSSEIIVAVLDDGIQLDHPDLPNISPVSFDTETGQSPSKVLGSHGTRCAGVIGAAHNTIGVAGVAPNITLMSISNSLLGTVNSRMKRADGINFAVDNGAAIISNSWSSAVPYTVIDDAISNALDNGRGGLGTVVLFATGNDNSSVSYPANSNPRIIAVGAMSQCGQRKSLTSCDGENWGSNYGSQLDIMAPGVLIPTTTLTSLGSYVTNFNGTSAATPHVAGVAALLLSVDPGLTISQVSDYIESTAQKVGGYSYTSTSGRPNGTWNNEMGYGLVNAYAAVQAASGGGSCTPSTPPTIIDGVSYTSNTVLNGCNFEFTNSSVANNVSLTVNSTGYAVLDVGFNTVAGATLTIN